MRGRRWEGGINFKLRVRGDFEDIKVIFCFFRMVIFRYFGRKISLDFF